MASVRGHAAGQTATAAAVARLRLSLGRATPPGMYGELIQFGKIIPWR